MASPMFHLATSEFCEHNITSNEDLQGAIFKMFAIEYRPY
jgi:hypothetical protein